MTTQLKRTNPTQLKLTDANVAKLKAPTESKLPELVWDTDIKGFGVLCGGTGPTKTYVVRFTVKGQKKRPRLKLGWTSTTTLVEAKRKAREYINKGLDGINPKDEERKAQARAAKGVTLDANRRWPPCVRSIQSHRLEAQRHHHHGRRGSGLRQRLLPRA